MTAILVSSDLMISSQVIGAAQRAGVSLFTAGTASAAVDRCREHSGAVVVLDLGMAWLDVQELCGLLQTLEQPPLRIAAFGPHVQEGRLAAAAAAGCTPVLARGQFLGSAAALLAKWTAADG